MTRVVVVADSGEGLAALTAAVGTMPAPESANGSTTTLNASTDASTETNEPRKPITKRLWPAAIASSAVVTSSGFAAAAEGTEPRGRAGVALAREAGAASGSLITAQPFAGVPARRP